MAKIEENCELQGLAKNTSSTFRNAGTVHVECIMVMILVTTCPHTRGVSIMRDLAKSLRKAGNIDEQTKLTIAE